MTELLGGIPYSPWLLPVAFLIGGFAWSAFGWYTSNRNPYDFSHPLFRWTRLFKSGGAGMVMGIVVFALTPPEKIQRISEALVHGEDGLVGPHEFAVAVGLAFGAVAASQVIIKRFRRPNGPPPKSGATPQ